ncbi:hypothetical protein [Bacillus sp. V59.32b]|uniref:hypothetical protein n=1 Tax=Bacillus sp. V59.32b TaxID=1758642 RepID=UPI001C200A84|nr:hypothetical protein [Bacillus sp. V59.32b]
MNTNFTEIIFLLDRSGSMAGLESDTIGGFNSLIEKQCRLEGETVLTTVLFDNQYEVLWNGIDAKHARLTDKETNLRRLFMQSSICIYGQKIWNWLNG